MGTTGPGSAGYVMKAVESIPGGTGTPGLWVPVTEVIRLNGVPTLNGPPAINWPSSPDGGRQDDPFPVYGARTVSGNVPHMLMPNNAIDLALGAIGKDVYSVAPGGPAPSTASWVRVGDNAVLTFAIGERPAGIVKGQPFIVDTGALQEIRPVLDFDANTITTGAFRMAHGQVIPVAMQDFHLFTEYTSLDLNNLELLLRTFDIEENIGGKYAWRYPQSQVNTWSVTAQGGRVDATTGFVMSSPRLNSQRDGFTPTPRNLSDPTRSDRPFTTTRGFLAFFIDPTDSGVPTLQRVVTAGQWSVNINNHFIAETDNFDDYDVVPQTPGSLEVTMAFRRRLRDNGPTGWNKFLDAELPGEFYAFLYHNAGTALAPVLYSVCIHAQSLYYVPPYNEGRAANATVTEEINGRATRDLGAKIEMFVCNAKKAAY